MTIVNNCKNVKTLTDKNHGKSLSLKTLFFLLFFLIFLSVFPVLLICLNFHFSIICHAFAHAWLQFFKNRWINFPTGFFLCHFGFYFFFFFSFTNSTSFLQKNLNKRTKWVFHSSMFCEIKFHWNWPKKHHKVFRGFRLICIAKLINCETKNMKQKENSVCKNRENGKLVCDIFTRIITWNWNRRCWR